MPSLALMTLASEDYSKQIILGRMIFVDGCLLCVSSSAVSELRMLKCGLKDLWGAEELI